MFTRNETAPAGGTTAARAGHLHFRTPASKTDEMEYRAGDNAPQLSSELRSVFEAIRALGEADQIALRGFVMAGLLAEEARAAECPKAAAVRFGVSASTVRAWCRAGLLGRKLGGRYWIGASERPDEVAR